MINRYEKKWNDYRKRRRLFLIVAITFLPGASLIVVFLDKIFGSGFQSEVVLTLWLIAFFITGIRFSYWKCPRCNRNYFIKHFMANQFAQNCLHCGLPKWADTDLIKK
jgi:hypothetical protein